MDYNLACTEVLNHVEVGCRILHTPVWTQIGDTDHLPEVGFKLHVSAGLDNAGDVLLRVAEQLVGQVPFKFARDAHTVATLNMGTLGIAQAGKVITVYPQDVAEFFSVVDTLRAALGRQSGPRPLSDCAVPDSDCLYYRYGSLVTKGTDVEDPGLEAGRERFPGCALPEGVENPFGEEGGPSKGESALFAGRYLVTRSLSMRGKGGVFEALDFSAKPGSCLPQRVVLKEARAFAERDSCGVDAVDRLNRQCRFLDVLGDLPAVPAVIDTFVFDSSTFVVLKYIDGAGTLVRAGTGSDSPIFGADLECALRYFLNAMVRPCHARGVLLNDISSGNLFMDDRNGRVWMCDLEEATMRSMDVDPYVPLATPGYLSPAWPRPSRERDLFALMRVALFAAHPAWHTSILSNEEGAFWKPAFSSLDCMHRFCKRICKEEGLDAREVFYL
ncbi:serine/threonine protein kinase [Nanchangia anserum]|uniref:Serine/threonine protein kinase n=1 Tax=Nanchangia anserum TaxID=2692125 RepID=A0A8I0GBK4_9ACTO|nr:serine/threonine protein kinase [Nanchangia anserum]MBD3689155.1 serine/threonine protein kinase [Nanchangia anserum]QOX81387.1 serine/threonine protein kinase [Nanchangia anserum]